MQVQSLQERNAELVGAKKAVQEEAASCKEEQEVMEKRLENACAVNASLEAQMQQRTEDLSALKVLNCHMHPLQRSQSQPSRSVRWDRKMRRCAHWHSILQVISSRGK